MPDTCYTHTYYTHTCYTHTCYTPDADPTYHPSLIMVVVILSDGDGK